MTDNPEEMQRLLRIEEAASALLASYKERKSHPRFPPVRRPLFEELESACFKFEEEV